MQKQQIQERKKMRVRNVEAFDCFEMTRVKVD